MVLVKIINGIYGYRPDGRSIVIPTTPKDAPIGVDEAEAERLVELGVARYVNELPDRTVAVDVATPLTADETDNSVDDMGADADGESGSSGAEADDASDAEDLSKWKYEDLKKLASDLGIDTGKLRKKEALIQAILEAENQTDMGDAGDVIE